MTWLIRQVLKIMLDGCSDIFGAVLSVTDGGMFTHPITTIFLSSIKTMGWLILAICIIVSLIKAQIEIVEKEKVEIFAVIRRIIMSCLLWQFLADISRILFFLGNEAIKLLLRSMSQESYKMVFERGTFSKIFDSLSFTTPVYEIGAITLTIAMIVVIVMAIKILWQLIVRIGMCIMTIMLGYLYLGTFVMGNDQNMWSWFKQMVALSATQFIQTGFFYMGMLVLSSGSIINLVMGLGILGAASQAEKLMQTFGLSNTGTGGSQLAYMALTLSSAVHSLRGAPAAPTS